MKSLYVVTHCDDTQVIDHIINKSKELNLEKAFISGRKLNEKIRKVNKSDFFDDYTENFIYNLAHQINRQHFGFHLSHSTHCEYLEYNADNSHYSGHMDIDTQGLYLYARKISFVMLLNDSDEYEGGEFQLFDGIDYKKPDNFSKKGDVIAFPSFMFHRVTPVTKGQRKVLVAWVEGNLWQ